MKRFLFFLVFVLLNAGVYTDDLTKCMIKNTSKNDLVILKKWIFFAFGSDKTLKKYVKISNQEKEIINKKMANYVEGLLGDKCKKEFITATKFEGPNSISYSFEYLGRIAGKDIINSPESRQFIIQFTKYIDFNKLYK